MEQEELMKLSRDAKKLLDQLKESRARGAASMSFGQHIEAGEELIRMKLAERYGFGLRVTKKGMK
jgi:hypothetical protein